MSIMTFFLLVGHEIPRRKEKHWRIKPIIFKGKFVKTCDERKQYTKVP
jgi:hypothetical protein